ncbi:phosphotransferase [Microtetraspora malaysiensis]|uniref:phosphotransferase n=1 Tax=Microtetraspora malaysiensis TaxID=161358 RepID=UPI003D8C524A
MATYTTLDQLDLFAVRDSYALGPFQAREIVGGDVNSSFRLRCEDGAEYTLTIVENRKPGKAITVASHTRTLSTLGIPTTEVVPDRNGDLAPDVGGRKLILKRWIHGTVYDVLPQRLLEAAGAFLGGLHSTVPLEALDPPAVQGARRLSAADVASLDGAGDAGFVDWLKSGVADGGESAARGACVVCHGDLFPDNIIERPDGSLVVIDWETLSLDDPLFDVGMAVVGLTPRAADGRIDPGRLAPLLSGYARVRPSVIGELARLPGFIKAAAAEIGFHRYHRYLAHPMPGSRSAAYLDMVDCADSATDEGVRAVLRDHAQRLA